MENNTKTTELFPTPASILPDTKFVQHYVSQGYALTDFISREKEAAKTEATRLRETGLVAVYISLPKGFFGVFAKVAEVKESTRAHKPTREYPPVSFAGMEFATSKEARAFANGLLEAAKNAEFAADLAAAQASKTQA